MGLSLHEVEAEALALPPADRAALARTLLLSLDSAADDRLSDLTPEGETEILRNLEAYQNGESQPVGSSGVFAKACARLRDREITERLNAIYGSEPSAPDEWTYDLETDAEVDG